MRMPNPLHERQEESVERALHFRWVFKECNTLIEKGNGELFKQEVCT